MGNSQSQGGPEATIDPLRKGFHVLKVRDHSPAFHAGLLSYFHFIVAVNGQSLDTDASLFPTTIKASIDQPVLLTVYSARSNDYAELTITPKWWTDNQQDGLIGCSIRYCDYQGALAHVWHVVEVLPNSPAQHAGLVVDSDYIVGTPEIVLREQQDLYALIAARGNEGKPLRLFVYSTVQRAVRDVTLCPRKDWGGEGLIGAELGYGALHKIPADIDSQYEDTDDEAAAHSHAHPGPAAPVASASPAPGKAASPIHTSPTVMYQPSAAPPTAAAPADASDASFTVMGHVPSFGAPAHSKYARVLATNLPLGPQEIRPATEFAAMAAPPTDALLAAKRASVDHGQHVHQGAHAHELQCDHGHDHGHHHHPLLPPPPQQQQQQQPGVGHVHEPHCDHGHEHHEQHAHPDRGHQHHHEHPAPHPPTSAPPSFVPMPTTSTVPPVLVTDPHQHHHQQQHAEQLHVLTPPPPPNMVPPTHFSPVASGSSAAHDGDVVPLVAADLPLADDGTFAPILLGRSPSPQQPAPAQQAKTQSPVFQPQQVQGYQPRSPIVQPQQKVPMHQSQSPAVQPQQHQSPVYQSQSPAHQPQHHQSPAYPPQPPPRSPSPVRPPPTQATSPPPTTCTFAGSPPVEPAPASFFAGVPAAGPQFISTNPEPDLSAFSSAAPLDLSTFGAPAPAQAPAPWVPATTPPVAIPGYHPPVQQQQATQAQLPPVVPVVTSKSPAFVPAASQSPPVAPVASQSPQFTAVASKSPAFAPTATPPPVAAAAPSWMPPAAPAMADMFARIEPAFQQPGPRPPSPQLPAAVPRSPSPAPPATTAAQSSPPAPVPAADQPESMSPPFSAAPPTAASATQAPAAGSPSPAQAPAEAAPRSVSPFTALFGSDPSPDTQVEPQGAQADFLSFIPQSPPQPAAAAPARSPSPQPQAVDTIDPAPSTTSATTSFVVQPAAMPAAMSPVPIFDQSTTSATYQPTMFDSHTPAAPIDLARSSVSPPHPPAAVAALLGAGPGDSSMSGSHSAALFDTFGVPATAVLGNDPFAPVFGADQQPAADASASTSMTYGSVPTPAASPPAAAAQTTIQDLDDVLDSMSLTADEQPGTSAAPTATAPAPPPASIPASTSMNAIDFFDTLGAATPPMPTSTIPPQTPPAAFAAPPVSAAVGPSPMTALFGAHPVASPAPAAPPAVAQAQRVQPPMRAFSPAPGSGTSTPPVPAGLFGNAASPAAAALFGVGGGGGAPVPLAATAPGVEQVFGSAGMSMPKSTSAASVASVGSASGAWNPPPDQGTNPFL